MNIRKLKKKSNQNIGKVKNSSLNENNEKFKTKNSVVIPTTLISKDFQKSIIKENQSKEINLNKEEKACKIENIQKVIYNNDHLKFSEMKVLLEMNRANNLEKEQEIKMDFISEDPTIGSLWKEFSESNFSSSSSKIEDLKIDNFLRNLSDIPEKNISDESESSSNDDNLNEVDNDNIKNELIGIIQQFNNNNFCVDNRMEDYSLLYSREKSNILHSRAKGQLENKIEKRSKTPNKVNRYKCCKFSRFTNKKSTHFG